MALSLPVFFLFLLQVFCSSTSALPAPVKFLPGFSGPLPFQLQTGYVSVGESESESESDVKLFYYFVKSEGIPENDPLLLWFTGGPGCSALSGLAFEIGPVNFKIQNYNGSLPELILNPYSWTKKASILFVDLPVGTGFSYATNPKSLKTGDFSQIHHYKQFLKKWFVENPEFKSNTFYIGGDSYSGLIVPVVADEILHDLPFLNLQGYILGNAATIRDSYINFRVPFAHRMTLISDELFQSLTRSCNGQYANIDPSNIQCLRHYGTFKKCISSLCQPNILLHKSCREKEKRQGGRFLYNNNTPKLFGDPKPPLPTIDCTNYKGFLAYYWANDDQVRKALHIHEGSIGEWIRCNRDLEYDMDIASVIPYHINLSSKGYRSLVYSGDHDMVVSHLDTQAWIKSLNYSIIDDWRPWFILDQVAGYTRTYANKMTFATIKGGGHTAEYTQKECSIMFNRWISEQPL